MTVSTTTYNIQFSGNGSVTEFATGFEFIQDSDLVVVLTASDGTDTTQTITTHYTVSGAGNDAGGTVTMVTAPASGETLTIYRDTTLTQATDYTAYDAFPEESHEQALDKLTLIAQEQAGKIDDRVIRFKETEDRSGGTKVPTLPSPVADKALGWDSDGNLTNVTLTSVTTNTDIDALVGTGDKRKPLVVNEAEGGWEMGLRAGYTAGGTADAITITTDSSLSAYNQNEIYWIDIQSANTGACTLNVDSIGVKNIKLPDGSDPAAGQVGANFVHGFWYDGTNFILVNPAFPQDGSIDTAQLAASAVETAKINDLAVTTGKLAADAVDGTKIADDSVDSEHIAAGAIDAEHIGTGLVVEELLVTHTFSTDTYSNTTFFTDNSGYSVFRIEFESCVTATMLNKFIGCQIYVSAAWKNAASDYLVSGASSSDTPLDSMPFNQGTPSITGTPEMTGSLTIYNIGTFKAFSAGFICYDGTDVRHSSGFSGVYDGATATAAGIRIGDFSSTSNAGSTSPGNVTSGTMRIYGVR